MENVTQSGAEVYLEPSHQTSTIELFGKIVNIF